jgi:spore maturation protein CgeB
LEDYRAIGARPIYCQEAANPKIYKPYDLPKKYEVTFIGQAYGDRPAYIKYLLEKGIDVHVWGPKWHHYSLDTQSWGRFRAWIERLHGITKMLQNFRLVDARPRIRLPACRIGGILSDQEMVKMYSRSRINLGFSSCGDTHRTGERIIQIRLRDFEIPMSGGFYMVEYIEELQEFFEIGKEIVCYTGPEDLVEKIKYYLREEEARERIRKAGYERCLKDHTWRHRFEKAFEEMGPVLCAA